MSEASQSNTVNAQVCDLCGSPEYQVFAERGRHGQALRTVICQECGLVSTNPRPAESENADFYKNRYWGNYKQQSEPDEKFFARRLPKIRSMFSRLEPYLKPGSRVLEVGAGVGALLSRVQAKLGDSAKATGIEPHSGHAKFAREAKGLDVRAGLLEEIAPTLAEGTFDLIVMNHVLEHTVSPTEVFATHKRLLKPGGRLVIEVPNIEAPGSRLSHFFHVAHHYNFSPATLKRLGLKTGFQVEVIEAVDGDLPETRLVGEFTKQSEPAATSEKLPADTPIARAEALKAYDRWYHWTLASLRKKITHWQRQRA